MEEQLLETWMIHNRINLFMLASVSSESVRATSASKGRTVGEQFAHIHNVRLMWLTSAAPELMAGLEKIEKGNDIDVTQLNAALEKSGDAIHALLRQSLQSDGKIKGFKPPAAGFLGYLISHESHHRGQIALTLKQAGVPLDKKTSFGMWEWGVR